ncbi:MAG TPA: amino acid permease [Phenylobacterium sp.]|jgi:arginine:agmatine antiporter|uniref:amino acid permease n=1 Tax=Phenylobacterium sp. TaxID=1871053 RepID=UPI002D616990|nr:amino acid permease [Phenylobacterium sp.]HZZ68457.1 amino acid permease [Phenylobacterium sp.]
MAVSDAGELSPPPAAASHHGAVGLLGAIGLVAGSMVGSGIFLLPVSLGAIGSISILGWIAATGAALTVAGVFAWLAGAAPEAKGLPGYVEAGLGPFFGVQTAATYWVGCWTGMVPIAMAVAGAVGYLAPALAGPTPRLMLTLAAIWLSVAAAWIGPRAVARVEGATLAIGLAPVAIAATAGWLAFHPSLFLASWNPKGLSLSAAVGPSALTAFFAFLGVECAAATAGVVRDPARNVGRASLIGVAVVAALYISACSVLMGVLPAQALGRSSAPFADAGHAVLGVGLAGAIAVCALLRAQGSLTGWVLVTGETARSGADAGVFPRLFRTRPGERVSAINLLAVGVLMSLVAVGTASPSLGQQFAILADVSVLLSLYAYALAGGSLIRISGRLAPNRRWAARLTALVAIAASVTLAASGKPIELGFCLGAIAASGLLYLWLLRR